ncbi:MAG: glucose 1-dehydrogenase [Rectinemataceae bacterium]|jgi:3-oxoacyl-[acyl-carrier protein] reductase
MDIRFDGVRVLVTGASTGIGAAIALALGSSGARVAVHYRESEKEARSVAEAIMRAGGEALLVQADLLDGSRIDDLIGRVMEAFGGIDVLVNNAGALVGRSPIEAMPMELYEKTMNLNMGSVFRVSKSVIPHMKANGRGSIINVTSVAARNGGGGGACVYAAAKGAVSTFTRGMAKELAPFNIRVNAIAPGIVLTAFHEKFTSPEMLKDQIRAIPMGRGARPDEIAGAAVFLASEKLSSYITGEIIEVNGGALMP